MYNFHQETYPDLESDLDLQSDPATELDKPGQVLGKLRQDLKCDPAPESDPVPEYITAQESNPDP